MTQAATPRLGPVILGSRSPRRQELLSLLIGEDRVVVRVPTDPDEANFQELHSLQAIAQRVAEIAATKNLDVLSSLAQHSLAALNWAAVLTADTVIVVPQADGAIVLGQPPTDDSYADVVRRWFHEHLLGREHLALTAVHVTGRNGKQATRLVTTGVTFTADASLVDWYINTNEPRGKAGGYGIQGLGSVFVTQVTGSLTNVVGLPLLETQAALCEVGVVETVRCYASINESPAT